MTFLGKIRSLYKTNKDLTQVAFANVISSLLGATFWLILASILLADDYGEVNYFIAIGGLLGTLAIAGGDTTVVTLIAKGLHKEKSQLVSFIVFTTLIVTIPVIIITSYLPLTSLIFGTVFFGMAYSEYLGHKLYGKYSAITIGQKVLQVVLGISLYFVFGLEGVIYGYSISYLVFSYKYYSSLRNFVFRFSELKPHFKFMIHSYSNLLSRTLMLYSDKLIIFPLYGATILGLYQLSMQFLMFISVIPLLLYDYLLPQESSGIERRKVKILGMIISAGVLAIMEVFSPVAITIFFPNFTDSINSIRIISVGIIPMTYTMITLPRLLTTGRSKNVMIAAGIFVGTQYTLITGLGAILGLEGLALAMVVALSTQAAYVRFSETRRKPETFA